MKKLILILLLGWSVLSFSCNKKECFRELDMYLSNITSEIDVLTVSIDKQDKEGAIESLITIRDYNRLVKNKGLHILSEHKDELTRKEAIACLKFIQLSEDIESYIDKRGWETNGVE